MDKESYTSWVLYVVIALLIGAGVGFWYGSSTGKQQGRADLLAEQKVAEEEAKKKAQEEIVEAANPFEEKNPLEGSYQNPFKQNVNPFAQ